MNCLPIHGILVTSLVPVTMYPHQTWKRTPRRSFHIDYIDHLGSPGTLLMQGFSIGGALKDAERRFPELTITRVYLQASGLISQVGAVGTS